MQYYQICLTMSSRMNLKKVHIALGVIWVPVYIKLEVSGGSMHLTSYIHYLKIVLKKSLKKTKVLISWERQRSTSGLHIHVCACIQCAYIHEHLHKCVYSQTYQVHQWYSSHNTSLVDKSSYRQWLWCVGWGGSGSGWLEVCVGSLVYLFAVVFYFSSCSLIIHWHPNAAPSSPALYTIWGRNLQNQRAGPFHLLLTCMRWWGKQRQYFSPRVSNCAHTVERLPQVWCNWVYQASDIALPWPPD